MNPLISVTALRKVPGIHNKSQNKLIILRTSLTIRTQRLVVGPSSIKMAFGVGRRSGEP